MKHGLKNLIIRTFVNHIKTIKPEKNKIIDKVKRKLTMAFEIIDMRPISFYLGLKV